MWRNIFRGLWLLSLSICFAVIVYTLYAIYSKGDSGAWATLASALAVVAALASAWSTQRVLELQEESQRPYVYLTFDLYSRYGLVQLRATNVGGGVAKDIVLTWDRPLANADGQQIRFSRGSTDIPVLFSNESVRTLVDGHVQLYKRYEGSDLVWTGYITFTDSTGKKFTENFVLSLDQFSSSLSFDQEEPKTHHELQKIPGEIKSLTSEIKQLRQIAELVWAEKLESESEKVRRRIS